MFFDKLFEFMVYYLAFLAFFALLGASFQKKHEQLEAQRRKSRLKSLYKNCPCRRGVENGFLSTACLYSASAGFMLALTNITLIANYSSKNFIVLALSLFCFYLGWRLKK